MPASSRRRKRRARVTERRQPKKPPSAYRAPGVHFTPAEERWMTERLAAFEAWQNDVAPAHKGGAIRRCSSPEGLTEEEQGPLRE